MYDLSYFGLNDLVSWVDGRIRQGNETWRQTRYLAFIQIMNNAFIKSNNKPKKPEDLFYIEGDWKPVERTETEMLEHYNEVVKRWRLKRS